MSLLYHEFWLLTWAGATITGLLYGIFTRAGWRKEVGMALMSVPVWIAFWGFIDSIQLVLTPGTVVRPIRPYRLSSSYSRAILIDIGYLGTGFLLWAGVSLRSSVGDIAHRLRASFPRAFGRTEGRSALMGYAWFPALLLGTVVVDWLLTRGVPAIVTGDDSLRWSQMTIYHAIMLSAAAAVTEELVYRVFLLATLTWLFQRMGTSPRSALSIAMTFQVLLFAFAHGGYGNLLRLVEAGAFALIAGFATIWFGVWAAIVLHFLIDLFVFGSFIAVRDPFVEAVLYALLAVNIGVAAVLAYRWSGNPLRNRAPKSP